MILITGGAGFIGSNLAAGLEAAGAGPLAVCDSLGSGDKWRNIAKRGLADLVAPERLDAWLGDHAQQVEAVFHMGAISTTTERDADLIAETNIRLSMRLWQWCARHDARFVYASSAATYGDGAAGFDDDPGPEALARLKPMNAYGWSKLAFDRWAVNQVALGGARPPQWAGLRFFNVYGPNEYHKGAQQSVVPQLYRQIVEEGGCRLFRSHRPDVADGAQARDFIAVEDCTDVMLWLYETPAATGLFNVGSGTARSFADLAGAVFAALGRAPEISYIDTPEDVRAQYQYFTQARMERLRAAGYARPFTTLEDGVGAYVRDFLAAADPYR